MFRSASKRNGCLIVSLDERKLVRAHLERLTEHDRRHRYDPGIEAEDLRAHFTRDRPVHEVIGWFENGEVRGVIDIYYLEHDAEAGLTLEEPWRGRGIAIELVRHAMRLAGSHGARRLSMPFHRANRSMTELAAALSSPESFGRWRRVETTAANASLRTWIDFDIDDPVDEPAGGGLVGWLKGLFSGRRG